MSWTRNGIILAIAFFLVVGMKTAQAADITWGSLATISGDSNVSTAGALVAAYNIGDPSVTSTTINGVPFAAFSIVDGGTSTTHGSLTVMGFGDEPMNSAASLGFASPPFSNLSANYQAMLGTGVTKSSNTFHFLDMELLNLTVGQSYTLQLWTNNSNATTGSASVWDDSGNDVQAIDVNTTDANGGVGQYVLGTFTADATSEFFHVHGEPFPSGNALLNGLQLRTAAVPEPGTLGLLPCVTMLFAAGPLFRKRRVSRLPQLGG
jgi:hypothetical protein